MAGQAGPLPIESCELCLLIYWGCSCGDSPISGIWHRLEDVGPKPERCNNRYHEPGREDMPMKIRLVVMRHCHEAFAHHVGGRCRHCGERD